MKFQIEFPWICGGGGMGARGHQRRIVFNRSHAFLTEHGRKSGHPTKRFAGCNENCGEIFFSENKTVMFPRRRQTYRMKLRGKRNQNAWRIWSGYESIGSISQWRNLVGTCASSCTWLRSGTTKTLKQPTVWQLPALLSWCSQRMSATRWADMRFWSEHWFCKKDLHQSHKETEASPHAEPVCKRLMLVPTRSFRGSSAGVCSLLSNHQMQSEVSQTRSWKDVQWKQGNTESKITAVTDPEIQRSIPERSEVNYSVLCGKGALFMEGV